MDVIIDWNLGNTIYHGLITLRLCGFPIVEIGVVSVRVLSSLLIRLEPWFPSKISYLFHGDYCHDVLVHRDHPK